MPAATIPFRFGFEAEYQFDSTDLIGANELHSYHCDCDFCRFTDDNGELTSEVPLLRAQRDSTCSGELITRPLVSFDEARTVMQAMQESAIEVDAIPGMNSGFHVHVEVDRSNRNRMNNWRNFFEFMRWEHVVSYFARGRFDSLREMNRTVKSDLRYHLEEMSRTDLGFNPYDYSYHAILDRIAEIPRDSGPYMLDSQEAQIKSRLFSFHWNNDRHSTLCVKTRHNTWEYRIWNSTRSAWRMEMFCGISYWLARREYTDLLAMIPNLHSMSVQDAAIHMVRCMDACDPNIAQLMNRQLDYINTGVTAPSDFTNLV
jgi:hypothetical protein